MKIVITGGHHSSAIPVIKYIRDSYKDVEIHFFGHKYSQKESKNVTLEYLEITKLGIKFYDLKAGKFYKTYSPLSLLKIPFGFLQALYLILKIRPKRVLSFGGYLAVPTVLVSKLFGIYCVTHEQTLVSGYANKLISKFCDKVLLSYPSSKEHFKTKTTVVTGLPLRDEIFKVSSSSFRASNNLPTIYITAGKTGSHKINVAVLNILSNLLSDFNVIHQCGNNSQFKDFDVLKNKYEQIKDSVNGKYFLREFVLEHEIGEAFSVSSFLITRCGAHIMAELLALSKEALVVPIPWVSHNEQYLNAQYLKEKGLAIIYNESDLQNPEKFLGFIKETFNLSQSKKAIPNTFVNNSAEKIVHELNLP